MMKLHIGCGSVKIEGYVNVDIRYLPNVDVVDNAEFLRKFQNKNVTEIYACHILEHFSRWHVDAVLKRWYNVLQPNGSLVLSVPDFEAIANHYVKHQDIKKLIGLIYGGQDYPENQHHCCWDFVSLKETLESVGFFNVKRYRWQDTSLAYFDDYSKCYLPHMDKENGQLMSLNVECIK